MISPCGGCDPHFAAAVLCYLSFFFSSCSFFLYWWWISIYREEQNPNSSTSRYQDPDSDCVALDVENPEVPDDDEREIEISDAPTTKAPNNGVAELQDDFEEDDNLDEEEASSSLTPNNQLPFESMDNNDNQNIIDFNDNDNGIINISDSINDEQHEEHDHEPDDNQGKSVISDNPYLNGTTYSHNVLWGLHGIFTNLIEAILAAVFYRGLFENNVTTSLIWLIGFSANFVIGNLLYILLLVYCTDESKIKELRVRWALESIFNVVKDLYYIWVGAALLDHVVAL